MKKPMPLRKIDEFGRILNESFETYPAAQPEEEVSSEEEAEGPQLLKDDEEDIDIESDDDSLFTAVNGEEEEVITDTVDNEIETTTNSSMQVVSLEDVLALLKQVQGETTTAPAAEIAPDPVATPTPEADASIAQDATAVPTGKGLEGGEEALKKVYFQGEGNEVLDSEFDFTKDKAATLDDSFDESYIDSIDGLPKAYSDFDDVATSGGAATPRASEAGAHVYGGTTQYADMDGGDFENPDMARMNDAGNDFDIDGTADCGHTADEECCEDDELLLDGNGEPEPEEELEEADATFEGAPDELPTWAKEFMVANGLNPEDAYNFKTKKEDLNEIEEEPELVYSSEYDGEANPDLIRFAGPVDPVEEEDEFEEINPEELPIAEEPVGPAPINANTTVNVGGQPIKIVLTGVVITENEIKYISESVSKVGNKLKAIKGAGNELQIVVEANNKQYTINYVDAPKVKQPTPFSIKHVRFGTLEEALGRINHNNVPKTQAVMERFLNESIATRGFGVASDADIFEGIAENVNYTATWTVKPAGTVNLKNGLNEVFSNIIQHGKEPNTLVKTNEGEYYILKGNLKERSSLGTKRELVDMSGKKSYGVATVVGIFENNSTGLGKVMEKLQRTSLPLLVWK
jgi:hypothetical protein